MKNLLKKAFLLLALVGGANASWAKDFNGANYDQKVTVPETFALSYGSYTGFGDKADFAAGTKIEYTKSNAKAVFNFTVSAASEFLFSLEGSNGNDAGSYDCNLEIRIWAAAGDEPTDATKTFTIQDNDNWNDFNAYYLFTDELAAGDYKLSIKWTDQANVQNIKMAAVSSSKYKVIDSEVSLMTDWKTKGVVNISNSSYSSYDNMEYTSAYDNVSFIIDNKYNCDLAVSFQASTNNEGCSIEMTLFDADGTSLRSETTSITKKGWTNWQDCGTSSNIAITAGTYKILRLKFLGSGSNVKELRVTPSNLTAALSENTDYTPIAATGVNVTLTRSITADKWATIVLPFAMTSEQITEAFGENVQVAALTDESTADVLKFCTVTAMTANQPYAIKVSSSDSYSGSATINSVTIAEATPTQSLTKWNFVGTYASGYIPENSYFFSDNYLWQADDDSNTIKPFRAYFTPNGESDARELSFVIDDDEITTIGTVKADGTMETVADGKVYNLNGQRVTNPVKGLYIVNGKKVFIQ